MNKKFKKRRSFLGYATIRAFFRNSRRQTGRCRRYSRPGKVLLTLYAPTHMQMVATVRESLAKNCRSTQIVPAKLEAMDQQCMATISEIVPQAAKASRSFEVKVGDMPARSLQRHVRPNRHSGRRRIPLGHTEVGIRDRKLTMVELEIDGHCIVDRFAFRPRDRFIENGVTEDLKRSVDRSADTLKSSSVDSSRSSNRS